MIEIYTDGSTRIKNQKGANNVGGHAWIMIENGVLKAACAQQTTNTTNNREELLAILEAFKIYGTKDKDNIPIIYTDSEYARQTFSCWMYNWARSGWELSSGGAPANLDIIIQFYNHTKQGYKIKIERVPGHAGHKYNELVDKMAKGEISSKDIFLKI